MKPDWLSSKSELDRQNILDKIVAFIFVKTNPKCS